MTQHQVIDPPVLAVVNQKGGVGKTATSLELAAAAARFGRVLLIDMDPQANATRALGLDPDECAITSGDLMGNSRAGGAILALADAIRGTDWPCVDAVPSNLALAKREAESDLDVPYRLRAALARAADTLGAYDLVVVDCPPSLGRLLAAALTAASHALLVTEPAADAIRGVANVIDTIEVVQEHLNPGLQIAGIVINRYKRTNERDFREAEIRERYGDLVITGHTTDRDAMSAAHGAGRSVRTMTDDGSKVLAQRFDELHRALTARFEAGHHPRVVNR